MCVFRNVEKNEMKSKNERDQGREKERFVDINRIFRIENCRKEANKFCFLKNKAKVRNNETATVFFRNRYNKIGTIHTK